MITHLVRLSRRRACSSPSSYLRATRARPVGRDKAGLCTFAKRKPEPIPKRGEARAGKRSCEVCIRISTDILDWYRPGPRVASAPSVPRKEAGIPAAGSARRCRCKPRFQGVTQSSPWAGIQQSGADPCNVGQAWTLRERSTGKYRDVRVEAH